jgi:hypothetical protein
VKWTIVLLLMLIFSAGARTAGAQMLDDVKLELPCADTIAYTEVPMRTCSMTLLVGGSVVYNTADELRNRAHLYAPVCDTALLPEIDFEKFTLIGSWIGLGNCRSGQRFVVHVCRDDSAKVYRHIVQVASHRCRGTSSYMLWIIVPKLPPGYTVVFEGMER